MSHGTPSAYPPPTWIDLVMLILGAILLFVGGFGDLALKERSLFFMISGSALILLVYASLKFGRLAIGKGDGFHIELERFEKKADAVLEKKADAVLEKKADAVLEKKVDAVLEEKKLTGSDEVGTKYRNHSEAIEDAVKLIRGQIESHKSSSIELRFIVVAMRYSMEFLRDPREGGLTHLLATNPTIHFTIKIAYVRPAYLARWQIDVSEFDWIGFLKKLPRELDALEASWELAGLRNVSLERHEYENMPHRHGLLINREHLFLGRVDWDHNTAGSPRISVGSNQYRYFDRSTDAGSLQIALFRHWFSVYSRFDTLCPPHAPTKKAKAK